MLVPVILSGGSGTRLWPMSRRMSPKQFMSLDGDVSLLEATGNRLKPFAEKNNIWVVTGAEQASSTGYHVLQKFKCVIEPTARNTAPAIGVMAAYLVDFENDPLMIILPADHMITDVGAFHDSIRIAMSAAEKGHLVTFGIKPTHPATGFGYIKANDRIKDYGPVEAFIEKPNKEKAEEFFKAGNYYWNSGMFVARSSVMLAEIATHAPEISSVLATMRAEWKGGADWQDVIQARFASMPSISIDYAVMEKSRNVVTVPCSIGWSDIGSWDAVYDIADKDADGNSLQVPVIALDTKNTLVFGDGKRLVATVGVEDLCIIDTADALLIAKRGHAEKVKDVVDIVKARGGEEHIIHRTAHRPWGSYTVLEDALSGFKVKRIEVIPGGRLSLQSHQHRSEHWVVVAGTATITRGDEVVTLTPNQSTYIPVGVKHRLENKGKIPIQLVEVQVGDYLGEDDIQRFDDVYGRS